MTKSEDCLIATLMVLVIYQKRFYTLNLNDSTELSMVILQCLKFLNWCPMNVARNLRSQEGQKVRFMLNLFICQAVSLIPGFLQTAWKITV